MIIEEILNQKTALQGEYNRTYLEKKRLPFGDTRTEDLKDKLKLLEDAISYIDSLVDTLIELEDWEKLNGPTNK